MKIVRLIIIYLLVFFSISCNQLNRVLKSNDLERKYKTAIYYYQAKDYDKAILVFEDLIPSLIGDKRSELVQFYFSYCHYYEELYTSSAHYFSSFYKSYGRSQYAEEALFMSAKSLFKDIPIYTLDQSNTLTTIEAFQNFIDTYPNSSYKQECNENIETLQVNLAKKAFEIAYQYEKLGRFESAVVAFSNFQLDFPGSQLREEAEYHKFFNQYRAAELSIDSKKKGRIEKALKYYYSFIERYKDSEYLKKAQSYFIQMRKELERIQ